MTTKFTSAEEAQNAFYEALANMDIDALMRVWSEDEEIVCIHPNGEVCVGAAAIRQSWQAIFANNPPFTIQLTPRMQWNSLLMTVYQVLETLFVGAKQKSQGAFLVTHVFQRGAHGWRLLARHTSMATEEQSSSEGDAPRVLH